jgi:hypothetical protein
LKEKKTDYFFEDLPVLGMLPPEEKARKFEEVNDMETVEEIREEIKASGRGFWPGRSEVRPCEHTSHAFGFVPQFELGKNECIQIKDASNIKPDTSLKNSRIKITLGRLRAADYPGSGMHRILFDFYAKNQLPGQVEPVHFNQTYRVQEKESAGITGYPIFIGLNVGSEGVEFKCFTVNVKNENDEKILDFLGSDVFQSGLKLATTAQPAIAPLTSMAVGITNMLAKRNRNVPVQDIFMGLDFTNTPHVARLAQGSYVAVQIPEKDLVEWDWDKWVYNTKNGRIVKKTNKRQLIPYNYLVFSVSKYEGT